MNIISKTLAAIACIAALTACTKNQECRIHGTVPSDQYDDKYIFLVPIYKPDSVGVDSVKIKGRTFEFVTEKNIVADIRLGYRYRFGTQNLLIVTEPGDVYAEIDSISKGWGTPQNDYLQEWKENTESKTKAIRALTKAINAAKAADDNQSVDELRHQVQEIQGSYMEKTMKLKETLKEGPLFDFLDKIYPSKQ
ncbi:MAG: DUF4369 domain-containing protein [Bacteroidales bacterium]|nr:DUF4369 domain-containing protein [Bacteroidales bacterium]